MLLLLRHGQAEWQIKRNHDMDSQLTPLGHKQIQSLVQFWHNGDCRQTPCDEPIGRMFGSPMLRAQQSAQYLEKGFSLTSEKCNGLSEAQFYVGDNLTKKPEPFAPNNVEDASEKYLNFRKDVEETLRALSSACQNNNLLAVTHGGFIKTALRILFGNDAIDFSIANASLTRIEWRKNRWHLHDLGWDGHLQPEERSL